MAYLQTLETNPNQIMSVDDIINFTKTFPAEMYPDRNIGKFMWTQAEDVNIDSDFGGEGGILGAMQKHKIDVLAAPYNLGVTNDLPAKIGFPVVAVPPGILARGYPHSV